MKNKMIKVLALSVLFNTAAVVYGYASGFSEREETSNIYALVPACTTITNLTGYMDTVESGSLITMDNSMKLLGFTSLKPRAVRDTLISVDDAIFMAYLGIDPRFGELRARTVGLHHSHARLMGDTVQALRDMASVSYTMKEKLREYVSDIFEFGNIEDAKNTVDRMVALANGMADRCNDLSGRYESASDAALLMSQNAATAQGTSTQRILDMRDEMTTREAEMRAVSARASENAKALQTLDLDIADLKDELSKLHEDQRGLMAIFKIGVGMITDVAKAVASLPGSTVKTISDAIKTAEPTNDRNAQAAAETINSLTEQVKGYNSRIRDLEKERSERTYQQAEYKGKLAESALMLSRKQEIATDMGPVIEGLGIAVDYLKEASSKFEGLKRWWTQLASSIQGTTTTSEGILGKLIKSGKRIPVLSDGTRDPEKVWNSVSESDRKSVGTLYAKYNALQVLMDGLQLELTPVSDGALNRFGTRLTKGEALAEYKALANTIGQRLLEEKTNLEAEAAERA